MNRRAFVFTALAALPAGAALVPDIALAGGHGRVGTFTGNARYGVGGRGELTDTQVILLDDFRFGSAPDPKIALGRDGRYDPSTLMGLLKSNAGRSTYALPAGIDASRYNEIWIWCERFNVPLASAKLN